MNGVIGFADFLESRACKTPNPLGQQSAGFTLRDREDLEEWANGDRSVSFCSSDTGSFAMLYQSGRPWASWGVVRQGRSVLLWDCVTLADIGRFSSMIDALAAVPIDELAAPVTNVIHFAAARMRLAATG